MRFFVLLVVLLVNIGIVFAHEHDFAETKQLIDASEKTYSSLGKEVEQKRGHINLVAERINSKSEALHARKQRVADLKEELKETKKSISEKEEQLSLAKKELEKADEQLLSVRKSIDSKSPGFDKNAAQFYKPSMPL